MSRSLPTHREQFGYSDKINRMLATCLSDNAHILLIGEKNGGIKSTPKLTATYLSNCKKIDSARHCMLFIGQYNAGQPDFNLEDWYKYYFVNVQGLALKIAALPGVFSQESLDKGTAVLLNKLPEVMAGKVLDFGCGSGVIACVLGKKYSLHVIL